MTIAYFILALLDTLSDVTELCYDLGQFTRTTILPALVYTYVVTEYVVTRAHKGLTQTFDTGETLFQSVSWG
jgi:hypothetical protein